jgi:hypothetical protein
LTVTVEVPELAVELLVKPVNEVALVPPIDRDIARGPVVGVQPVRVTVTTVGEVSVAPLAEQPGRPRTEIVGDAARAVPVGTVVVIVVGVPAVEVKKFHV